MTLLPLLAEGEKERTTGSGFSSLEKLSEFGPNPEGGVTRLGFSEADLAAAESAIPRKSSRLGRE